YGSTGSTNHTVVFFSRTTTGSSTAFQWPVCTSVFSTDEPLFTTALSVTGVFLARLHAVRPNACTPYARTPYARTPYACRRVYFASLFGIAIPMLNDFVRKGVFYAARSVVGLPHPL